MILDRKQARWQTLVAFVVLHGILKLVFFSEGFRQVFAPLVVATRWLMSFTMLAYLIELAFLVCGLLLLVERYRWKELGLGRHHLLNALILLVWLWGLSQSLLMVHGKVFGDGLAIAPGIRHLDHPAFWGGMLEAWLGSALFEEIAYRGFLLPELYLIARRWWPDDPQKRLFFAVVLVQLYFGINHLPAGLTMGLSVPLLLGYVAQVTLVGVLFAALFLQTGNLFLVVGIHALLNRPVSLFVSPVDPSLLVLVLVCVLLVAWSPLSRLAGEVFTRPRLAEAWQR